MAMAQFVLDCDPQLEYVKAKNTVFMFITLMLVCGYFGITPYGIDLYENP